MLQNRRLHFTKTVPLLPDLSMPVFERLLKASDRFELKRFRMTDLTYRCFSYNTQMLSIKHQIQTQPNLLAVATLHLMLFVARLPKYTMINPKFNVKMQKNLRKVVLDAREPDTLTLL